MAWTDISSSREDQDSPVDEDLMGDIIDNTEYNFDHAVRGGTHATGVRLAIARGYVQVLDTTVGADYKKTGTVTFSTDAADGNPNFDSSPFVWMTVREILGGGTYDTWSTAIYSVSPYIEDVSPTDFDWCVQFHNGGDPDIGFQLWWMAIGAVTAGE